SPASVVTDRPTAACAWVTQDLTDSPSMCTVKEPHCDRPQPNFRPCWSRSFVRTNKSDASGGASTETSSPLSLKLSTPLSTVFARNLWFVAVTFELGNACRPSGEMGSHGLARICADDGIQRCYR